MGCIGRRGEQPWLYRFAASMCQPCSCVQIYHNTDCLDNAVWEWMVKEIMLNSGALTLRYGLFWAVCAGYAVRDSSGCEWSFSIEAYVTSGG